MKDFIRVLLKYVPPYKGLLSLNVIFNIMGAVLSLFTYATIMPILNILFGLERNGKQ